jgi:hypothetical protein
MVSQDQAKKEMVLQHSTQKGGSYIGAVFLFDPCFGVMKLLSPESFSETSSHFVTAPVGLF